MNRRVDWDRLLPGAPELARRVVRLAASYAASAAVVGQAARATTCADGTCAAAEVISAVEAALEQRNVLAQEATVDTAGLALIAQQAQVLVPGSSGYPPRLSDAWPHLGAPLWLFARGAPLPDVPAVAVVGTRKPSLDGVRLATQVACVVAQAGCLTVSGMARGIDQAAHRGALAHGGMTAGVIGTGFGVDYPSGSADLRRQVSDSAGLFTELVPGAPPHAFHFPARNRILAGLVDALVVVEGLTRSGALHSARLADAMGRRVVALPGSPNQPTAQGPLALIRDGVPALARLEDLLDELPQEALAAARLAHASEASPVCSPPEVAAPDAVARSVHALLGQVPATPGALAAALGDRIPVGAVLAACGRLLAAGLARESPRGYVRALPAEPLRAP